MSTGYVISSVLLAVAMLGSAFLMFKRHETIVANMTKINLTDAWLTPLATTKTLGAIGLLIGLAFRPIGIAASIGLVLYFIGAVYFHLRAGDAKGAPTPAVLAVVSALPAYFALSD